MRWFFILLTFFPLAVWADQPAPDTLSTLRFNTVCANCHEGECSGRLSFSLGPEAAFSHIRRFAGDVDDTLVRQLQDLLEYMKQECAFAPLPIPDMREPLRRETLDAYRDQKSGHYFIPLGKLEPGTYRLSLRQETPVSLRIELLNRWFEFLIDECADCNRNVISVTVQIDEPSNHYLRLRSPTALRLEEFTLTIMPPAEPKENVSREPHHH